MTIVQTPLGPLDDTGRRHRCPPPDIYDTVREVWDSCLGCSKQWVRVGPDGPKLDRYTREPFVCDCGPESPPQTPQPSRNGHVSVEPPQEPSKPWRLVP